jgi:hypothetical protein
MRSKRITVRLPFPLHEALIDTCQARGFDHLHACILGACIMLVQNERRKSWVPSIANAKPKDQDFMLEKMLSFPTDKSAIIQALRKL